MGIEIDPAELRGALGLLDFADSSHPAAKFLSVNRGALWRRDGSRLFAYFPGWDAKGDWNYDASRLAELEGLDALSLSVSAEGELRFEAEGGKAVALLPLSDSEIEAFVGRKGAKLEANSLAAAFWKDPTAEIDVSAAALVKQLLLLQRKARSRRADLQKAVLALDAKEGAMWIEGMEDAKVSLLAKATGETNGPVRHSFSSLHLFGVASDMLGARVKLQFFEPHSTVIRYGENGKAVAVACRKRQAKG